MNFVRIAGYVMLAASLILLAGANVILLAGMTWSVENVLAVLLGAVAGGLIEKALAARRRRKDRT